jgi:hypothetical protein
MTDKADQLRPERIIELSDRLSRVAGEKIGEIAAVNRMAKMLAINAMVVAARAGEAGRSFGIVADEFKRISTEIDHVASALEHEVKADLNELSEIGGAILGQLRGARLADLALNAIEIIDRNLYERTCDVRWWATDSAIVACAQEGKGEAARFASQRLKVILDAYTVYLDLWICDLHGRVLATGRPGKYPAAANASVSGMDWFTAALRTKSGDDFTAADIRRMDALGGAPVATYAAAIREGGRADGRVIGVLGIHFDWSTQAQVVVENVRLTSEEKACTRVLILDQTLRVLASSDGRGILEETVKLKRPSGDMGSYADGDVTVGYALTPGYETYKGMGWYGCIIQDRQQVGARNTSPPVSTASSAAKLAA